MLFVMILLLAWFGFCLILLLWSILAGQSHSERSTSMAETRIREDHSPDDRRDMTGVREPRRPKPFRWPPRAAAAAPDDNSLPKTASIFAYSDATQQQPRVEDGLA